MREGRITDQALSKEFLITKGNPRSGRLKKLKKVSLEAIAYAWLANELMRHTL